MRGPSQVGVYPVVGALVVLLGAEPAWAASYRYIPLDPTGENSSVGEAINDAGQVLLSAESQSFVWKSGVFTPIPARVGQSFLVATNISPWGLVVGSAIGPVGVLEGFAYSTLQRRVYSLNIRHYRTDPYAINGSGQVTGSVYFTADIDTAFIYRYGEYVLLHPPGSTRSHGAWINDAGQVVGTYNENELGFSYLGGRYEALSLPNGTNVVPYFVNSAGDIAGYYATGSAFGGREPAFHGVIRSNGVYRTVDYGRGEQDAILSVNTRGDAIGQSYYSLFGLFGGKTSLINPFPNLAIDYVFAERGCLNESGTFVGSYMTHSSSAPHAFVAVCDSPGGHCTP